MTTEKNQQNEALLLETLLSGLDARESARRCGSQMLIYLADMLVHRAREELEYDMSPSVPAGVSPPSL